jgi:hypothetical protein
LEDSEIDLYVTQWLPTANQRASFGWWLQGARLILDRASDQRAFAGVADAGATGRLYGNVAGFGELQQALEP